jgi:ribosome-associated protein
MFKKPILSASRALPVRAAGPGGAGAIIDCFAIRARTGMNPALPATERAAMTIDPEDRDERESGEETERPSKSAAKREAEALQSLGEALVELPRRVLNTLPVPEDLRAAIDLARNITSRPGLRRQRQLIGKLMRRIDAEPIRAALAAREQAHRATVQIDHQAERWRDRLLAEGDAALEQLLVQYPHAERQPLRQQLRAAAGTDVTRATRARRELFRAVRRLIAERG